MSVFPDNISGKNDLLAEEFRQALGYRCKGELGLPLSLGLAQVGAGNDSRAMIKQVADGGDGGNDTLVAGDLTGLLVLGNVKVAAEQDFLALDVNVINGFLK